MVKKRLLKLGIWLFGTLLGVFLLITSGLYFFKDEICGYVISEVNQHLKAKVKVAEVDLAFWSSFPNLSVDFKNVFIQDSYKNSTIKDTLLSTERIRLKFNPVDLWNEKYNVKAIDVSPGTIQLKINTKGENNYDILKSTKDSTDSKFKLNLKKVRFEKIRFSFNNKSSKQDYSTFFKTLDLKGAFSEKKFSMQSRSKLIVNRVRSGGVTLISNKAANFDLNILVNNIKKTFEIPNAILYVENLPFNIKGKVTSENLKFRIHSKNLELTDVANNFSHSSIENVRKYKGTGKVHFNVKITGKTKSVVAPEISCSFGIKRGVLTEPSKQLTLNNINLKGSYSNRGGKEKEFLNLSSISFSTAGGPFKGNLLLTHFESPIYQGKAKGILDLSFAQNLFSFPGIEKISGNVDVNSDFNVQAISLMNQSIQYEVRKCEGDIRLKDVNLQMMDDKRLFEQLNGFVYLRDNEIGLDEISLRVGASDLQVNGVFKNIIGFLRKESKLNAEVDIKSNFIDIQDLSTESKEDQITDGKDWIMPANLEGKVSLNAGDINYEKHHFKKFSGEMVMAEHIVQFSELTVQNANADIRGGLTIEERSPEIFTISTQLASDNIEFKSLFREWNNFEQEVIGEDNISGKAHVLLDFSAPFDLKNGVQKNSIKSQIQLKIIGGKLKNVSTFKTIIQSLKSSSAKFILKKSNINDFEERLLDLKFETLENTLIIRNGQLEIPEMTIHSNAMDLEVYGKHDFDDNIDYHFEFRFRDIKTMKNQEEFGQVMDDESGIRIFIRMHGNLSNPIIEWDQNAKKEQAKENREAAKKDAKSIFKTEFGMFKNDTTVKMYQPIKQQKEELKMEFGPAKKEESTEEINKPQKDSKIGNTLKAWKKQAEKEKEKEFEIGD